MLVILGRVSPLYLKQNFLLKTSSITNETYPSNRTYWSTVGAQAQKYEHSRLTYWLYTVQNIKD